MLEAQGGGAAGSPMSAAGAPEVEEEEEAEAEPAAMAAAATPAPTRREGVPRTRIDFMSPDGIF